MSIDLDHLEQKFLALQDHLCKNLAQADESEKFIEETWQRPNGGGGRTRVIANGNVFEKGGVNFSHVFGQQLPPSATQHRPELAGLPFHGLGVSLVMHPNNPYVPTSHANVRCFYAERPNQTPIWWFGGGFDLTPYYGFTEDCVHWHQIAKQVCEPYDEALYPRLKKWCDDYFYLKHRQEPRGIGGLFFDDFNEFDFQTCMEFALAVGQGYLDAYLPIVQKRKNIAFGETEKQFQRFRRGRYVEFNLVYDRGTLFGLQSGGRTESILMSLPPEVCWEYNWAPAANSEEARLYKEFLIHKEWI